jgi:glycogen phosphorylase
MLDIKRRLLDSTRTRFPGDNGRMARVSLIEEGRTKHFRTAKLAIVCGSVDTT